ncbi:MAG: glutaredoxin family protein [Betaproteobacteria bacterium]
MKLPIACLVSMLLVAAGLAVADMYKWVDESGKTHYTDSPPPGKKAQKLDLKINSIAGPPVVSAFTGGAASTSNSAAAAKVKVYGATWCGYCKRAKAYLQARRTPFEDIDVERSAQGQSEFLALGGRGVPVILVGDQRMDGYRQETLEGMLKHAGL